MSDAQSNEINRMVTGWKLNQSLFQHQRCPRKELSAPANGRAIQNVVGTWSSGSGYEMPFTKIAPIKATCTRAQNLVMLFEAPSTTVKRPAMLMQNSLEFVGLRGPRVIFCRRLPPGFG